MNIEYIIVQAGGKGSRLGYLTANKPKCLVPVSNKPMLFHLFDKFKEKKFIVIGDYKFDVLNEYLNVFSEVEYVTVNAKGKNGTCAGIKDAINLLPQESSFMLVWSDLILSDSFVVPEQTNDYVALSGDFKCRWKYEYGCFSEEASTTNGVAGLFLFKNKSVIEDVPKEGEFVRYLSNKNINFSTLTLRETKEYGLLEEYKKLPVEKCRPFNRLEIVDGKLTKHGVNKKGEELGIIESSWYKKAESLGYNSIPNIYSYSPLSMELINGRNIYEYKDYEYEVKRNILSKTVATLKELHSKSEIAPDYFSVFETYFKKTFNRIEGIRSLVPFANDEFITINNKVCKNVFYHKHRVYDMVADYKIDKFTFIHGDCTFSNMMLKDDSDVVLIDPRGYFGKVKYYGDPCYDWAKLYYSLYGNYDRFNLKHFSLSINSDSVEIDVESNGWETLEDEFWNLIGESHSKYNIKLLHALIWLSLTTYAWEDYDSICAAFYIGCYYLSDLL